MTASPARTQIGIIGAGPSGLLLAQLLHLHGVDSVVLERRSREHVLGRIRAGVLEQGSVEIIRRAGVGARMDREGLIHEGLEIAFGGRRLRIELTKHTGRYVMIYGQTELTRDLVEARDAAGACLVYEVDDLRIEGAASASPMLAYRHAGKPRRLACDFVAGCDGFHGISRRSIPAALLRPYEKTYAFGWLGLLSDTRPVSEELVYVNSERGFALCSMRSRSRSRYYLQCRSDERVEAWSDERFWEELRRRLPAEMAQSLEIGPSLEKSIAPLRSFVAEPMCYGRLFLAGDAAHIVPPTGAKGLNLAIGDVHGLAEAFAAYYRDADERPLAGYSSRCLARVWRAQRFSWWLTRLLHELSHSNGFERRMQRAELDSLAASTYAQAAFAEYYVGSGMQP